MNWLTPDQRAAIQKFALAELERETCGFVLSNGEVIQLRNTAADPVNEFAIAPADYIKYEADIRGVWHSHLTLAGFSPLTNRCWHKTPCMGRLLHVERHLARIRPDNHCSI